jgi:hypothetical protein
VKKEVQIRVKEFFFIFLTKILDPVKENNAWESAIMQK